ncbi:MAG: thiazole synthase [Ottowia sp.]
MSLATPSLAPQTPAGADDCWRVGDVTLTSRFLLGTARYPSPHILREAMRVSGSQIVTVGLKRQMAAGAGDNAFIDIIRQALTETGARLLPNTAGCASAREAVQLAHMARELYGTPWIKLEVIGDDYTLQPDPQELVRAAAELAREGFTVFPYCTDDLVTCKRLLDAGCPLLMPWGAPIGSGQGLTNPFALRLLRERLPDTVLIIDAGMGAPSHAAQAMEMGFDAVLLNSAISYSPQPVRMAAAFRQAIEAGRSAHLAGIMAKQDFAVASTPVTGSPFLL